MKVAVIGAGVMGPGIAQTFLMGGHDAVLIDISEEALEKGVTEVDKCLKLLEEMELINGASEMFARMSKATSMQAAADADLVVEAVPENMDIKESVYQELDTICKPDAVIVSNTSTMPVFDMFPDIRPGNLFVSHFFNPPAIHPLVEIVCGDDTNKEKVQWLRETLEACGKKPVVITGFIMGFLMNRLQTALSREALYLLDQGVVSEDDLDIATQIGLGFKTAWQGIFSTMDYIGLDTVMLAQEILGDDLYSGSEVSPTITEKVEAGKLGLKTGEGFYTYGDDAEATQDRRFRMLADQLKLYKKYGI